MFLSFPWTDTYGTDTSIQNLWSAHGHQEDRSNNSITNSLKNKAKKENVDTFADRVLHSAYSQKRDSSDYFTTFFKLRTGKGGPEPHLFCLHNSQRSRVDCVFQVFCTGFGVPPRFPSIYRSLIFGEASPNKNRGRKPGSELLLDKWKRQKSAVTGRYRTKGPCPSWSDINVRRFRCPYCETMVQRYSVVCGYWYETICVEKYIDIHVFIHIYIYQYMIATFLDVLDVFRVNILEPSTKESTWSLESSPTSCYWSIPHTNASANSENTPSSLKPSQGHPGHEPQLGHFCGRKSIL